MFRRVAGSEGSFGFSSNRGWGFELIGFSSLLSVFSQDANALNPKPETQNPNPKTLDAKP